MNKPLVDSIECPFVLGKQLDLGTPPPPHHFQGWAIKPLSLFRGAPARALWYAAVFCLWGFSCNGMPSDSTLDCSEAPAMSIPRPATSAAVPPPPPRRLTPSRASAPVHCGVGLRHLGRPECPAGPGLRLFTFGAWCGSWVKGKPEGTTPFLFLLGVGGFQFVLTEWRRNHSRLSTTPFVSQLKLWGRSDSVRGFPSSAVPKQFRRRVASFRPTWQVASSQIWP